MNIVIIFTLSFVGIYYTQLFMLNSANKLLLNNTIALYIRTFVVLLILLFISRLLLKELGITDFGIYNVVGSVVVFFTFLNNALTQAIQRFITYALGRGDKKELNRIFSTSIITQFINIALIIILAETLGLWLVNKQLNIPLDRFESAQLTFQLTIITLCLSVLRVPYEAMIISHEKMSVYAFLGIADAIMKLIIVLVLPLWSQEKIIIYSLGLAIESFILLIIYRLYCIRKIEGSRFIPIWDWSLSKKILTFSGWSLCGGVTNIATQNGFTFILNIFYGVAVNAAMGIANQVSYAISSFTGSFQTSFRPQLIKSFAQDNYTRVLSLVSKTSKFSFLLIFFPALFLIINMEFVLKLWLGIVPNYTIEFCRLILVGLIIDATTGPYNIAIMATGKIRNYQIAISLSFTLDLFLSYSLIKIGISPEYILYSRIVTRGLLNMFIGWYFLKELLGFNIKLYIRELVLPILYGLLIITAPLTMLLKTNVHDWELLLWSTLILLLFGVVISFYVILNKDERTLLIALLNRKSLNEV